MLHLCTYFNVNYLDRGIALYNSLKKHCENFTLHILCMDKETEDVLSALKLSDVHLVALKELEDSEPGLLEVKGTRSLIEYYFTCTPVLPWFLINRYEIDMITYLDSDLFFFSSLDPLYEELGEKSVLITSHNFPPRLEDRNIYGKFNVGLLIFRNDKNGRACLEWWMDRCLEWCYDRVETDRFADQKYLDQFDTLFNNVTVSKNAGVGLAPWNIEQYNFSFGNKTNEIYVDTDPLIFFHYQGFKKINRFSYKLGLTSYNTKISNKVKKIIYNPYADRIHKITRCIQSRQAINKDLGGSIRHSQSINTEVDMNNRFRLLFENILTIFSLLSKSDIIFKF